MRFTILYLIITFLCVSNTVYSQNQKNDRSTDISGASWIDMMQSPDANFYTTQQVFNNYWRGRVRQKGDGWKVFKRWESFMETRVNSNGKKISIGNQQQLFANSNTLLSASGTWSELGPNAIPTNGTSQPNGIGRVNDIAFHPTDSSIIWVGAPAGGLWKSTNGGISWVVKTDNLPTLGVSSILIDGSNTNKMYIGTGDRDAGDSEGKGVYFSNNGGDTWVSKNNGIGNKTVNKLIMKSSNHNEILAATNAGIYKTTNGGATWYLKSINANFKDIVYSPTNSNIIYATKASSAGAVFYRSMNGGNTWTLSGVGLPINAYRMSIGVSVGSSVIYVVAANSNGFIGIYSSGNGGLSFSLKSSTPNILGYSITGNDNASQAWYDLAIEVDPVHADTLYVGGVNTWKSTDGGVTWSIVGHWVGNASVAAVHADQHCLKISPITGDLYNGNDGGIYKTSDYGSSWTDISSNLAISQIYKIGQSKFNSNQIIAGFQDNGTAILDGATWSTEIGGDGMECIIDPTNATYMYGSLYYGEILRSNNGGTSFSTIADSAVNGITEYGAWITPYCLKEGSPSTMFIGYDNVWRSTNVNASNANSISWTKISSLGSGAKLRVVENSPADNNILYISRGNSFYRCDNVNASSPTWTTLNGPGGIITDIEAHPSSSNIVYVTAGTNVYKSVNKGLSWVSISGNLPTVTMNCLVYDTTSVEGLYVGTDVGVYYKDSLLSNWVNYSSGMPSAPLVTELEIYYSSTAMNSRITASTYGRGVWQSDLYLNPSAPITADFSTIATSICVSGTLTFTDISTPTPVSWSWSITPSTYSFVGGTSSNSQNPQVQFTAAGNYTISLIATNANGPDTITKTNYISVTSAYSTPYLEDFQTFTVGNPGTWTGGWTYSNTGSFNWRAKSGSTQTSYTGPTTDHTLGTAYGRYLYTEASFPAAQYEETNLISPCINIPSSGTIELSFWYHMKGSGINGLNVDIYNNGVWTNNIYSLVGPQQANTYSPWLKASISLSSYLGSTVKLRFRVVRGSNDKGDVAIDDIEVKSVVVPVNDEPCGAISLGVGNNVCQYDTCTNVNATTTLGVVPPGCGGSISEDVWYKVVVPSSGKLVIDANPVSGSFNDGAMAVYSGSCTSLSLVDCNDDFNGSANMPHLSLNGQTPGDTLFIRFWKYSGGTGQFLLCVKDPPHFVMYPGSIDVNYTLGSSTVYVSASPNITWSVTDNASWLTVSPISGTGDDTLIVNYSANASAPRVGRLKGIAAGMSNKYVYINQRSPVTADFTSSAQMICSGTNVTFTNTSLNGNSYVWYVNGVQQSTATNYNYTFSSQGNYRILLKAIGTTYTDSTAKSIFVGNFPTANAGTDTNTCSGYNLQLTPGTNEGIINCNTACTLPTTYCSSISNDNSQEYIKKVQIGDIINNSSNNGGGYSDYSQSVFVPVIVDSSYTLKIGAYTSGLWLEYIDAFIDWNRNGIFDEPAISLGSGTFAGDSNFVGIITVPSNAVSGKTKMRIIMKYNSAISSGCGSYNYGETEDYMLYILDNGVLGHSWTGPSSFTSNLISPTINNISANNAGNYILTVTNAYSCTANDTVNISVTNSPTVSLSPISGVCDDVPAFALTQGSPSGGVYTGTGVTGNMFNPSVAGPGSHTITYTVTNSNGCSAFATQNLIVYDVPVVSFTGLPSSICENAANVTLTGNPAGGIFTGSGIELTNQFNPTLATAGNHAIQYKFTNSGGCSDSISNSVVVYSLPTVNAGNDTTINYNNSASLSATVGNLIGTASYSWTPASKVVNPSSLSTTTTVLTSSTLFNISVTDNSTACVNDDDKIVNITGGPLNLASLTSSEDTICSGDSVVIVALASGGNGTINYSWTSFPLGFSSTNSILNISPTVSTTYIITLSDNNTTITDSIHIIVNQTPYTNFNITSQLCEDESAVAMTSITPIGGTFVGQGVVGNTFDPQIAGVGVFPITYTYVGTNTCVGKTTKNVTVNALPSVSIPSMASTCDGVSQITLSGGTPYGGTYSGQGVVGNKFYPSSVGLGIYTIKYSFTSQSQCSAEDSTSIIVNSSPIANAGSDQQISSGATANLLASGSGGSGNYTYSWSPSDKLNNSNISNPTTVALTTSQVFTLNLEDNASSCSDSDVVIITVTGGALSGLMLASQSIICAGDSIILTAVGSGGTGNYTYQWSSSPAGFSSSQQIVNVAPSSTTAYIVSITDGALSTSASQFIIVNSIPIGSLPSDTAMCSNDQMILDAGGGYSNYLWSNGDTNQIINIDASSLPFGFTDFAVTISNSIGCSIIDSTKLEVREAPSNLIADDSVCLGYPYYQYNALPNMSSYLWNTGDTTQSITVNTSDLNFGNNIFWVSVYDNVGCFGSDTANLYLDICESIYESENGNIVKVYPNPSNGVINIDIESENEEDISINIFDSQSKLVFSNNTSINAINNTLRINLNKLSKGVYIMHIKGDNTYSIQKLIIQ